MFLMAPYFWGPLTLLLIFFLGTSIFWNLSLLEILLVSWYLDYFQLIFFVTLFIVSFSILLFSFYYFSSGSDYIRFMAILFSFILSMMILIFHKGPLMLFMGWDGLGVTSYLLVAYYLNFKSSSGSMTTVMTNRLGDVFLFIFIVSVSLLNNMSNYYFLITLFLILCAFTKSAQAPFSSWLPMAMAAPTPVSSLVHSSTLVTAGLYLLMKYSFYWSEINFLGFILLFGIMTMFIASIMAFVEKDFKKIIALSTLSQLGFMMTGLGLSCFLMSFFHLITHAFFKSCMFVQVGGMIVINNTSQDGRSYSFSGNQLMNISLGISCLSLCGFPFLSGFYSKDMILMGILGPSMKNIFLLLLIVGIFFTFLYSLRIMIFSQVNSPQPNLKLVFTKNYFFSSLGLVLLGILSGYILFNFIFIPPLTLVFFEKLIPLFYWMFLFFIPFFLILKLEKLGGMLLQDSLVLFTQKFLFLKVKSIESLQLSFLDSLNKFLSMFYYFSMKIISAPIIILIMFMFMLVLFSLGVKHIFLPKSSQ